LIELRPYQRAAIDAVYRYFEDGGAGNPLVTIPTGGGKSPVLTTFIKEAIGAWPETRVLCLVHVKELIEQSFKTLMRIWPEAPATIYSAGLGQKDLRGQIVFGSIQSIYKRAYGLQRVDLVIVDEAHMIPHSGDGMYRKLLVELLQINPYLKVIGFTATPYRLGTGLLTEGDNAIFDAECYDISIRELIELGFLCPPVSKSMGTRFDLAGVRTQGGEFVNKDLALAVDQDAITRAAVDEIVAYGQDRRSWLVFGVGVEHALRLRDEIRARGIRAETITGDTLDRERTQLVAAYRDGRIRCLTNCDVLTTGFDAPQTDLLAVLRPTKSAGLWVQMVGRGTRLAPGKTNCLVLDFGENTARFGPIDMIKPKGKTKGGGAAPIKQCPECESIVFAGLRECPDCGYEFPFDNEKVRHTASTAPLLSTQAGAVEWVEVSDVGYARHEKPGKPPSLKVIYRCGLRWHNEWVCFEHDGYARRKAVDWWRKRAPGVAVPDTVTEAMDNAQALAKPKEIAIRPNGRFTEIMGAAF
jgi:DNA repair protein RadD